jgi:phage FluMu gp28-like protein
MGQKSEISWKRRTDEGEKLQVYAHHVGKDWRFYQRERRFDDWMPMEQPALEDWLALLDGIQRRIARRLIKPEEEQRVKQKIRELFPSHPLS